MLARGVAPAGQDEHWRRGRGRTASRKESRQRACDLEQETDRQARGSRMGDILAECQRIVREHEVKLLIGEALAAWEKAGVLEAIELHRPYAVVQIACLEPVNAYLASGLV